jgi:hypothetical protein
MRTQLTQNSVPENLDEFFPSRQRDAFHEAAIQRIFHGTQWYSVLIQDNGAAFYHAFAPLPIAGTTWKDIDPFLGYYGPILTSEDQDFARRALEEYSSICRSLGIVAEVMRFNPLLENHQCFKAAGMDIRPVKSVVIVECDADEAKQSTNYNQSCRRRLRSVASQVTFEWLSTPAEREAYTDFYYQSLERVAAGRRWFIPRATLSLAYQSDQFGVAVIKKGDAWLSASLVLKQELEGYYLLAANSSELVPGANEMLIHRIGVDLARSGIKRLMLGGGNTTAEEDPLLQFKRKFSKGNYALNLGRMVHHTEAYTELCASYEAQVPVTERKDYFLKYRLLAHG